MPAAAPPAALSRTAFDYVIVGAGSAGCVLANRLSRDPRVSVCLVEAGGRDDSPRVQIPAGTVTLYRSRTFAYQYQSTPQPNLDGRRIDVPRGKALGGSSSMNSMIYIRGHRSDYDRWAALGCDGWSYDALLPLFRRSERNLLGQDPALHGGEGELSVERPRDPNPLSHRFVAAAAEVGLAGNDDFNGPRLEGAGIYDVTQTRARRLSSYRAFVHPVRQRPNLQVLTGARVLSLRLDGRRVLGVDLELEGHRVALAAARETVLAAGAIGSPELLLASGIGDGAELRALGLPVRHHLPGVGRNLQDHFGAMVTLRTPDPTSLGLSRHSWPRVLAARLHYALRRKGWLTTNYVEAGGFASTRYAEGVPDVQFHFIPAFRGSKRRLIEWGHGCALHVCVLRPQSRGRVTLALADGRRQPAIDFNFLDQARDGEVLVEGLKLARRILRASPFAALRGREIAPGPAAESDEDLLAFARARGSTVFHPAGTCRMGRDEGSVVTPDLRVVGLEGLRVCDASIMPTLVSGNTNAPSIMIGEKGAELLLGAG